MTDKKRLIIHDSYVVDKNWKPVLVTRKQAEMITDKKMDPALRRCRFAAVVCDCGDYFRGNYGGQPYKVATQ